jgi:hypothetical protein
MAGRSENVTMLPTTHPNRRSRTRATTRRLLLERLEARNQPAVVVGAGLAVKEFFAYTGTTFPTDMAFGQGGSFRNDLFFADANARRIYRVSDLNNDHDAMDAGEGGILFQYNNFNQPVSLLFGSGASPWGDDLFVIDDAMNAALRISDDSGSLVPSVVATFPAVNFFPPTLGGAAFSADGQFLLVNDALKPTNSGGGDDGRVYKVSSTGATTLWATGGNLPNGLWDNNGQAAMSSDGWFTVAQDAIDLANGPSQIVQFRDNNGDGDALDLGEGRVLVGSNVLGLTKKAFAFGAHDVLYVAGAPVSGDNQVFRFEDLNHDGDYFDSTTNAFDAGESTVVLDGVPGSGITSLRVGPDGAVYVGAKLSSGGIVYRVADGLPPVEPTRPDLTIASDSGLFTFDNVTRVSTPTFTGSAEAGTTVRLYSHIAGLIGTTTADAGGAWTITSITLSDGVHQITATATDAEGNVSNTSNALAVMIDTIAPLISATLDRNSGATGWYNLSTGAPTATFSGSDGGSGVASVSSPFVFGEGRNLKATGTVTDLAGNSVTDSFFDLFVDLTPPTISALLDKPPASTGWYNLATGAPTATFSGSDDGSGVASVSSPHLFGEGQHLRATGTVTDLAGNSATDSFFDLFVDLTPPLISATLDRQPASTGWYNLATGAPIATIFGSDAGGSGVDFVSDPFQFGEGRNLSAPGLVIDVAGNSVARDIFALNVDLTPPLISATLDREPASTGWYNLSTGAPIATIYGSDAGGSGVVFVSGRFQFGEGQNLSAPGTVIDAAGNSVVRNIFSLNVDLTPPLISATLDRQPASTGWYNLSTGAPIATIYGSDAGGSGVAFVSSPFQFGEGQNLSAPGTVIDVAGNSVVRNIFSLNVDLTPPVAPTITSPTHGTVTNSTVLTITGVAEAGSRVEVFDNGGSIGTVVANAQGQWSLATQPLVAGDHVFSAAATDVAGNTGSRAADVRVTVQNTTGPRIVPISISVGQVNLNGGGPLAITILSSASFDARTLNLTTLRLNGSKATSSSLKDVNGDGRLDLVLQFRREDFVDEYTAAIKKDLADGRLDNAHQLITLTLTGKTKDGKDILAVAQVDMFMSGKKLQELVGKLQPRKKR